MIFWFNKLLCRIFGHRRGIEDMGGVVFEVCTRCNWVGRHAEYPITIVRKGVPKE
jgi:hypothetical protein